MTKRQNINDKTNRYENLPKKCQEIKGIFIEI